MPALWCTWWSRPPRLAVNPLPSCAGPRCVDTLLRGCDELLSGRRKNGMPYHYFGGECLQHPLTGTPGEVIFYCESKL